MVAEEKYILKDVPQGAEIYDYCKQQWVQLKSEKAKKGPLRGIEQSIMNVTAMQAHHNEAMSQGLANLSGPGTHLNNQIDPHYLPSSDTDPLNSPIKPNTFDAFDSNRNPARNPKLSNKAARK